MSAALLDRMPPDVAAGMRAQMPASGTRVQALLSRLESIKSAGDGRWYARCPAHADKSPSLSIRDTGDKILVHCFTGCDPEDVLTAVGLKWRDLYADAWDAARHAPSPGARAYWRRTQPDPIEVERNILALAAAELRAERTLSIEDQARVEVALERVRAWEAAR